MERAFPRPRPTNCLVIDQGNKRREGRPCADMYSTAAAEIFVTPKTTRHSVFSSSGKRRGMANLFGSPLKQVKTRRLQPMTLEAVRQKSQVITTTKEPGDHDNERAR